MTKVEVTYYAYNKWKIEQIEKIKPEDRRFKREKWPDNKVIDHYISKFSDITEKSEQALRCIFSEKPIGYIDEDYIYIKVSMLNDIYSTELSSSDKDGIVEILNDNEIKDRLSSNVYDSSLVKDICERCKESKINKEPYSFITKYCSHQNEELYPIYDRYVAIMLRWYRDLRKKNGYNDFTFEETAITAQSDQYDIFREVINRFKDLFDKNVSGEKYSYKEIDMFLWTAGKNYFPIFIDEKLKISKRKKKENSIIQGIDG